MLSITELKNLDRKGLMAELEKTEKSLIEISTALKMKQDKKSHLKKNYSRYIAQIQTTLTTHSS